MTLDDKAQKPGQARVARESRTCQDPFQLPQRGLTLYLFRQHQQENNVYVDPGQVEVHWGVKPLVQPTQPCFYFRRAHCKRMRIDKWFLVAILSCLPTHALAQGLTEPV